MLAETWRREKIQLEFSVQNNVGRKALRDGQKRTVSGGRLWSGRRGYVGIVPALANWRDINPAAHANGTMRSFFTISLPKQST